MYRRRLPALIVLTFALASTVVTGQVVTSQIDNARDRANIHETILTSANVNAPQFGKLFSLAVDGDVYAQPPYVPNLGAAGSFSRISKLRPRRPSK
jgi:hypothetical protein